MNFPRPISSQSTQLQQMWPTFLVVLLSWLSIVLCLDPAGSYPSLPEGPGLTVDEIFNVEQGVYLWEQTRSLGWLNLVPGASQEAYRPGNSFYLPDHPPLGRLWLGVHNHLTWWLFPPYKPEGFFVTACARTGSSTAFALTVLLVGWAATRWNGPIAGGLTALSLVLMPRVYGHAHLASLETITNLTCTAAVLSVAHWWNGPLPPTRRTAILTGVLWGLALLTKIQAILIPIPVCLWALWRWRKAAAVPLLLWGATAVLVFYGLWPYLWFDPINHVLEYLGRTTNRATINVWYLGQKFKDKEVPWHYPFAMFALTVPLILHGLGVIGLLTSKRPASSSTQTASPAPKSIPSHTAPPNQPSARDRDYLILGCMIFPLIIFALPGIAVYDGERLFLTVFPLWSIFVGRGWYTLGRWLTSSIRFQPAAIIGTSIPLVLALWSLISISPCHLSYYNNLTSLAPTKSTSPPLLEVDYWGSSITRSFLQELVQQVPEGEIVAILPTLHQFQADDYWQQSPILRKHRIKTIPYEAKGSADQNVVIFQRLADLPHDSLLNSSDQFLVGTVRNNRLLAYLILKRASVRDE